MNILHQKSWHVRTKENIQRVRRDEEKAAKEEEERKRKIELAEQEARTQLLRERAKLRVRDEDTVHEDSLKSCVSSSSRHIDFFSPSALESKGTNAEREADKKQEQEKLEKNIGLLRYLHEPTSEPWYLKGRSHRATEDVKLTKKQLAQKKSQNFQDPLRKMKEYSSTMHKHKHKQTDSSGLKHKTSASVTTSNSQPASHTSRSKSIEELRAERLKREREERLKTEMFINKKLKGNKQVPEIVVDDRKRGYNSAFNPHLSRQERGKYSE